MLDLLGKRELGERLLGGCGRLTPYLRSVVKVEYTVVALDIARGSGWVRIGLCGRLHNLPDVGLSDNVLCQCSERFSNIFPVEMFS